jgi:hypothetical protein
MKKSNLFLVAALVAATAFPVVKSLKGAWKRSADDSKISSHMRPSKSLDSKDFEEKMDHESQMIKKTLIIGSNLPEERNNSLKLYTYVTKQLLNGASSKKILKDAGFQEKLKAITNDETKETLLKAISQRLSSAESRFSPSKNFFGFGAPKIFSSRDQAQIIAASIVSRIPEKEEAPIELKKTVNDLREAGKDFLDRTSDSQKQKKITALQKRTYQKTLEEIAKQFKSPGNQVAIVQFLINRITPSQHHEIQEGIEEHLSKKNKKTFKQLWNQQSQEKTENLPKKVTPAKKNKRK